MQTPIQGKLRKSFSWQSMTFHQLQVFEAAARLKNFTRAAEELRVSQPTISIQIKQITKIVGLPLFDQVNKRLYLTEAGEILFKTCQSVLDRLDHLDYYHLEQQGQRPTKLRLATTFTAQSFLPKLLNPFCHQYPDAHVALEVIDHDRLLSRLNANLDDLYILSRLPEQNDLEAKPFLCNPLVVVAPPKHPLAQTPRKLSLAEIAQERLIVREWGSATREASEALFRQQGVTLRTPLELGSNEAIKQAVYQGLGLAILSRHSLMDYSLMDYSLENDSLENDRVTPLFRILEVEYFPIHQQWYLVYSKNKPLSPTTKTFRQKHSSTSC